MKKRGFEVVSKYADASINLPKRATYHAAGYDFEAAEDIVLPSFWKSAFKHVAQELKQWIWPSTKDMDQASVENSFSIFKPTLVPTGIKAYMQEDEYLQLVNRSSNPLKRFLTLPNGVGIIDADYYNSEGNEGHIYVQLLNFGPFDQKISKGERIAQGIFMPFLKADEDTGGQSERSGGFGSSDE